MPVSISTTARAVALSCGPRQGIAAYFAPTARCHVRPFRNVGRPKAAANLAERRLHLTDEHRAMNPNHMNEACCVGQSGSNHHHDWLSGFRTYTVAWVLPVFVLLIGLLLTPSTRILVWTFALAWMGVACLINARRCGRTHCRFTGPYFLLMIVPVILLGLSNSSADLGAWTALGLVIVLGSQLIWWATERLWGRYSGRGQVR